VLEPTIYRTWDKHANHYATDAVETDVLLKISLFIQIWLYIYIVFF
jgi:hypothetical protein